jgi:hypothetical protein
MRRRVVSVWLLCDSIIALRRASSCRVAVWLELMNSIHHPSSIIFPFCGFFAYVTSFARFA